MRRPMKTQFLVLAIQLLLAISNGADIVAPQVALPPGLEVPQCAGNVLAAQVGADHNCAAPDHQPRQFQHYSLCFRQSYKDAEWSAYCLRDFMLQKSVGRTNDFRPDPQIVGGSATLADYKKSGWDRGHLTPAGDMVFSREAMSETFYMSNMTPQAPDFNRGIWKHLEDQVREWAERFGRAYVVSGPVLDKSADEYTSIGQSKVAVPEYFYKVILVPIYQDDADKASPETCASVMAIGFIIPNKKCQDDFWNYAASVDQVEAATGLDFYPLLDDALEAAVEAESDIAPWR